MDPHLTGPEHPITPSQELVQQWNEEAPRFGVGWYALTAEQLSELPEQDRTNSVESFGGSTPVLFDTPEKAQRFLNQIVTVNGEEKIKELTPLGSSGLFVCYLEVSDDKKRFVKYKAFKKLIKELENND